MTLHSRNLILAGAAVVALAAGAWAARSVLSTDSARDPVREDLEANWLRAPRPLPEFALTGHDGEVFSSSRLEDAWTLMFFGFSNCPDVCPMGLYTLAQAERILAASLDGVSRQVVFVSVDPMRDTPEKLDGYVRYFNPDFVGVTGELAAIQNLTRDMGVAVRYIADEEGEDYTVEHTASLFLVNPDGDLTAIFTPPHEPERLASEYATIVGSWSEEP